MPKIIDTKPEVQEFDLHRLEHAHYNPRAISEEAATGLRESLHDFGLMELPVVNVRHDPPRLVSGHQRVTQLIAEGYTHAPCVVVRFDDAAEIAANVTMNNTAIQGTYDAVKAIPDLDRLRERVKRPSRAGFEKLATKLREEASRARTSASGRAKEVTEEQPTRKDRQGRSQSKAGRTYRLGDHLLHCGPFQDGVIAMLGTRKKADFVIADPPQVPHYTAKPLPNDAFRKALEDQPDDPEVWARFIYEIVVTALKRTTGAALVFAHPRHVHEFARAVNHAKGVMQRWLVLAHGASTTSPSDYQRQHDFAALFSREVEIDYYGDARPNVMEANDPRRGEFHPHQTPLSIIRQLVGDLTPDGSTVLDLCAGGGTVLAVCEEMGRVCLASEIDPEHCDTIRARWAAQVHGEGADWQALTPEG